MRFFDAHKPAKRVYSADEEWSVEVLEEGQRLDNPLGRHFFVGETWVRFESNRDYVREEVPAEEWMED